MKKNIFSILFAVSSLFSTAQKTVDVVPKSSISFEIKNFGVNVDGHFKTFFITTLFNSQKELVDIKARIKVESITTGMQSRDKHLFGKDYFHVDEFPEITFETVDIKKDTSQKYILTANLTIKEIKQEIVIPIHIEQLKGLYIITSDFMINRKDFGVGKGSLVLGKTVKISVKHVQK